MVVCFLFEVRLVLPSLLRALFSEELQSLLFYGAILTGCIVVGESFGNL